MKKLALLSIVISVLAGCSGGEKKEEKEEPTLQNLTQYVDPFIGTGFHGHVFLGANVPFGAVQLGPTNITQGWDWCSGYHYSDSTLIGFSHTHLSGTGIGDLGDILFMPITGEVNPKRGTAEDHTGGYIAYYKHKDETAKAGYYSVKIEKYDVLAELTSSARVGLHRYTFPKTDSAHILIDLERGIGWDAPVETYLEQVNDTLVRGYRFSKGWAKDQRIFFAAVYSKPIIKLAIFDGEEPVKGTSFTSTKIKAALSFDTRSENKVLVKVGISPVSMANALANIKAETPDWNFDAVASKAEEAWNKELNKVAIKTRDVAQMKVFYTALYHTMIAPSIFNDANGDYSGTDKKVYNDTSFTNLTTFSLWDTYRAAHPLYTILQTEKVNDMINTMLHIYKQQGKLPVWHLMGNETNTMVGYSAIPVIVDAYLKGFDGFDTELAWEAVKNTAMLEERGVKFVKEIGFIPADSTVESVAMGLEYAISDASVALMAKKMGLQEDFEYFSKRGQNYRNYFDSQTRFARGRVSKDKWRTPFSPFVSRHRDDDFCEGNAWQYTWLVPQDVQGLIGLMGGDKPFIDKLDSLFTAEGNMGTHASSDITGLIGQYAHGNEPGHHITYLYPFAGAPWKTAEKVRYIMDSLYTDRPDGLCGNEDVGQMSAWYVLSAMGFYPVNPSNGVYVFGSPLINEATLHIGQGKTFIIKANNNSSKNIYIQSITLNEKPYGKSYIRHEDIMRGGELILEMGDKPHPSWGTAKENRPPKI